MDNNNPQHQIPCPSCGRLNDPTVKFCNYCGKPTAPAPDYFAQAAYLPPPAMPRRTPAWMVTCIVLGAIGAVVVVIGIMAAISLPNFIRIKDKAKEAEVKQNLHAIQLALERYATDNPSGNYPLILMGGDWTDSYVVWRKWVDGQTGLNPDAIVNQERRDAWLPAGLDVGDSLVMDSYMPSYPANPFDRQQPRQQVRRIHHYPCPAPSPGTPPFWRTVGGRESNKMYEVFGPVWLAAGQSIAGDYYVHHIFNDPPYNFEGDPYKTPVHGYETPSGNEFLVGNFSYWPRGKPDTCWSLDHDPTATGYTLAGYGSPRTAGQDVYNRNGNYQGRFRTEPCTTDCTQNYYPDDVPCICSGNAAPTASCNNGGSDTIVDGVIITLDSGL
jgi:type II secretory pathway pseudopilin PulG